MFSAEIVTGGNDTLIKFIVYCTCTPVIWQRSHKEGATSVLLPFPNESPASPTSFFAANIFAGTRWVRNYYKFTGKAFIR